MQASSGLQRWGTTRKANTSAPVQRSASRRNPAQEKRKAPTLNDVEQGLKELYSPEKVGLSTSADLDIVLVPGLGAHPERSWQWKGDKDGFNWTNECLKRDFPRARVLLFMYQSSWTGPLQVHQFMNNVANQLLTALKSVRTDEKRPIAFIGHSMGGIVIARAVTLMANMEKDDFPFMFEATAACVFFGTPFGGAETAAVAAMYANIAEKLKAAKATKLLDLLKPDNEELHTLRQDFVRLATRITPAMDVFCFWEEKPTDFAELAGLPGLFGGLVRRVIPTSLAEFVSRKSATLDVGGNLGLACNHRDLVKFENDKDKRWTQFVREKLNPILQRARLNAEKRIRATRGIDRELVSDVLKVLNGAQPELKRDELARTFAPSEWITKDALCAQWLASVEDEEERRCLWIRGPEGRGKTGATMAVLQEIEAQKAAQKKLARTGNSVHNPVLLAYFFCNTTEHYGTAEDLLKSLIRQLIFEEERLAPYAKVFLRKTKDRGKDENGSNASSKAQVQLTVENLWQALQDMLSDEALGSRVYFIVNNLHVLPEAAESTKTLLKYISAELGYANTREQRQVSTRWLLTSRDGYIVRKALTTDNTALIDLADDQYGGQVQLELRKHAKKKIADLSTAKKYNKAIAYFASSLIGNRAENTQWIDVTCMQLQELQSATDLKVRRVLETMPRDLGTLLHNSWSEILTSNDDDADKLKEMLRALVLTYDDPTEGELAILTGLTQELELPTLVQKCKPLLTVRKEGKDSFVCFMHVAVKTYLLKDAEALLGLPEDGIKWQHGVLALRAFAHVREAYNFQDEPQKSEPAASDFEHDAVSRADSQNDDDDTDEDSGSEEDNEDWDEDDSTWDDDVDETERKYDLEYKTLSGKAYPYMAKHWIRHASKATVDIAEDLSQEEEFWSRESPLRRRWLVVYAHLTNAGYWEFDTFTALHAAAAFGYRELVSALIKNRHEDEIKIRDAWYNTPLHFAASFGRAKIVEEILLHDKSVVDDGAMEEKQTPLSMAAHEGKVEVMKQLMERGADPTTIDDEFGSVINGAIESGNRQAVELLIEDGRVSLSTERDNVESPLETAALLSDVSMLNYLIEKYAERLPEKEYSKALVKSAEAGRVEVFNKLLEFRHQQEYLQKAIDVAAEEDNWDIVRILLEKSTSLHCEGVFHRAATNSEELEGMMDAIWKYTKESISRDTLNSCLYEATDLEKEETVKLLLQKFKADSNATGNEYGDALTAAAYDGANEGTIVRLLLDAGANPNGPNGYALQAAAGEGHYTIVEELIRRHADVNAMSTNENCEAGTALQAACEGGQLEIVKLLLQNGANPNLGRGPSSPPIWQAAQNDEKILEELVAASADVNVVGGPDNSSPLITAAAYLPFESVRLLIDANADVNLPDDEGNTPLISVALNGDRESVAYLLDHGADILHANKDNENALQTALKYEQTECAKLLADCLSVLLEKMKEAMGSGDGSISSVVRSMREDFRAMDHLKKMIEDEDNAESQHTADVNSNVDSGGEMDDEEPAEKEQTGEALSSLDDKGSSSQNTTEATEIDVSRGHYDFQQVPTHPEDNHINAVPSTYNISGSVPTQGRSIALADYGQQTQSVETSSKDTVPAYSPYNEEQNQSGTPRPGPGYLRRPSWDHVPDVIRPYEAMPQGGNGIGTITPTSQQWSRRGSPLDPNTHSSGQGTPLVIRRKPTPSIPTPDSVTVPSSHAQTAVHSNAQYIDPKYQQASPPYFESQPWQPQSFHRQSVPTTQNSTGHDRTQFNNSPQWQATGSTPPYNSTPPRRSSPYERTPSQPLPSQRFQGQNQGPPWNASVHHEAGAYSNQPQHQQRVYSGAAGHPAYGQVGQNPQGSWPNVQAQSQQHRPRYDGEDWA